MSRDQIANAIAKIRNALLVKRPDVDVELTNSNISIIRILKSEGYVKDFTVFSAQKRFKISVQLKYINDSSVIRSIKQISKPGSQTFERQRTIERCSGGFGINILSTSKGIMTDKLAKRLNVGGEVICSVF